MPKGLVTSRMDCADPVRVGLLPPWFEYLSKCLGCTQGVKLGQKHLGLYLEVSTNQPWLVWKTTKQPCRRADSYESHASWPWARFKKQGTSCWSGIKGKPKGTTDLTSKNNSSWESREWLKGQLKVRFFLLCHPSSIAIGRIFPFLSSGLPKQVRVCCLLQARFKELRKCVFMDLMWCGTKVYGQPPSSTGLWTNEGVGVEQSQHHLRERTLQGLWKVRNSGFVGFLEGKSEIMC